MFDCALSFQSFSISVADFGLAAEVPPGVMLFDAVGTPNYIAPEILLCLEQEPEGAAEKRNAG